MSQLTPEQQSARALAEWLSAPLGTHPVGVDPDVVEAIIALNPAFGLTPRIDVDDVLASVTSGPFAGMPSQSLTEVPATAVPANTGFRRAWLSWGGSSMLLLAAVAMFVVKLGLPGAGPPLMSADAPMEESATIADGPVATAAPAKARDLDFGSRVEDVQSKGVSAEPISAPRVNAPAPVAVRQILVPEVVLATAEPVEEDKESEVALLAKDAERATADAAKSPGSSEEIRLPVEIGQPAAIAVAERHLAAGEPGLAAAAARAGLALGGPVTPWRARLFTLLGDARHQLGDDVTAKEAYRQAVKLSDDE